MTIHFHTGDLPLDFPASSSVAIDTEAMGLTIGRDRLCLVQLSTGNGDAYLVQMAPPYDAPRLKALLTDSKILKLFHFARFDVAILKHTLGVTVNPIYCTKIASKLSRTYTDRHGLKDLCSNLLGVSLNKEIRLSDWGAPTLTAEQQTYAAQDVLYLHKLKDILGSMLVRENKDHVAQKCFDAIDVITDLDIQTFDPAYIFSHS